MTKINKELFLNCWCNYAWSKKILYWTVCWNQYTWCKQCDCALTPVGIELALFKDKETAKKYREHIFKNPERTLVNFMIPGLW